MNYTTFNDLSIKDFVGLLCGYGFEIMLPDGSTQWLTDWGKDDVIGYIEQNTEGFSPRHLNRFANDVKRAKTALDSQYCEWLKGVEGERERQEGKKWLTASKRCEHYWAALQFISLKQQMANYNLN